MRHRMAAMGSEEIVAGCQRHCEKEHARHLIQSIDFEKKNRGIHQLCLIAEQRDVPDYAVTRQVMGQHRTRPRLNVEIGYRQGVLFNEFTPGVYLIPHQCRENLVGLDSILYGYL